MLQVSLPGALDQLLGPGGGRGGGRGGGLPAQQPEHRRLRQHGLRLRDGLQQHQVQAAELLIYSHRYSLELSTNLHIVFPLTGCDLSVSVPISHLLTMFKSPFNILIRS